MIKIYSGLKGLAVLLSVLAAVIIVLSMFSWGIANVIQLLLPLLIVLSYLLIAIFLLGILPATFFKKLRPTLCMYSALMSYTLAVTTWMVSFFFVIKTFGFWGVFLAFLLQFLAPIALAGALLKGSWPIAIHLSAWISFIYGMRFYNKWLLNLSPQDLNAKKGKIIDIEIS